jgi:hypothetical protein
MARNQIISTYSSADANMKLHHNSLSCFRDEAYIRAACKHVKFTYIVQRKQAVRLATCIGCTYYISIGAISDFISGRKRVPNSITCQ